MILKANHIVSTMYKKFEILKYQNNTPKFSGALRAHIEITIRSNNDENEFFFPPTIWILTYLEIRITLYPRYMYDIVYRGDNIKTPP